MKCNFCGKEFDKEDAVQSCCGSCHSCSCTGYLCPNCALPVHDESQRKKSSGLMSKIANKLKI